MTYRRGRGKLGRTVRLVAPLALLVSTIGTTGFVAASKLGASTAAQMMVVPAGNQPAHIESLSRAVLPDGRLITAAGKQLQVGLEPFGSSLSPDGKTLLVSDSGNDGSGGPVNAAEFIDTTSLTITSRLVQPGFFVGTAFSANGKTAYISVANDGSKPSDYVLYHTIGSIDATKEITATLRPNDFPAGLSLAPNGKTIAVVASGADVPGTGNALCLFDAASGKLIRRVAVGNYPYQAQFSADSSTVYVSNWGTFSYQKRAAPSDQPLFVEPSGPGNGPAYRSSVWAIDANSGAVKAQIQVGPDIHTKDKALPGGETLGSSHPSAMILSKNARVLYVAVANDSSVAEISTTTNRVIGSISVLPYANAPKSTIPNALALTPDGKTLYVAEAGLNAVAAIDTASGKVLGHIPTGFYPTAVQVSSDGKTLYVVNAKGVGAGPNGTPRLPSNPSLVPASPSTYDQSIQYGTVSAITIANEDLAKDTQTVLNNDGFVPQAVTVPAGNPIPTSLGQASPIKHVIFLTKENRTYDQVMGDYPRGNADPSLVLYGKGITPNQHAFADKYAFSDNFFADAQSSGEGHQWLTAAGASDYNDKTQVMGYSGRRAGYVHSYDPEDYLQQGYIWSNLANHGLDYRSYGEGIRTLGFSQNFKLGSPLDYTSPTTNTYVLLGVNSPAEPGLKGHIDLTYPSYNLKVTDTRRANEFIREYNQYEAGGNLPSFMYAWLPNDHTQGTASGFTTPGSQVADNDQAVGKIVDAVSHSPDWKSTVIFITEDDAQDGQDHVDAYRTLFYAISPWVKPGYLSSAHYDTASILRTIDLIFDIPPMTQFDAAATPMYDIFDSRIHLSNTFGALSLTYKPFLNSAKAPFAALSNKLQLWELDHNTAATQAIDWYAAKGDTNATNAR